MHEVTVDRQDLLARVKANREQHEKDVKQAKEDYLEARVKETNEWLGLLNEGESAPWTSTVAHVRSNLDDYDQAVAMLEMSVDERITLEAHEFTQLVLDKWGWKAQFDSARTSNSSYLGK